MFLLRCLQVGLRTEDLDFYTIGMVNDMFIEQANDNHPELYPYLATQEDFDNFGKRGL